MASVTGIKLTWLSQDATLRTETWPCPVAIDDDGTMGENSAIDDAFDAACDATAKPGEEVIAWEPVYGEAEAADAAPAADPAPAEPAAEPVAADPLADDVAQDAASDAPVADVAAAADPAPVEAAPVAEPVIGPTGQPVTE